MEKNTYHVVVVSANSWHQDGSPIIERDCGHNHRTLSGTQRCLEKLYDYNPRTQTHAANWHRAEIRSITNVRLTEDEQAELAK